MHTFYIVKSETTLLDLPDIERPGIIPVRYDNILIQEPTIIQQLKVSRQTHAKVHMKRVA